MNKRSFLGGSSELFLFRENSLMAVAAVVSLLLQVISFFTTLNGARAYFEATFALAPLFFALAVQSVVYFLENSIRARASVSKAVALTLAIACSSYFSFVGIYNTVEPPEQYLEQTYNSYTKTLTAQLDGLLAGENTAEQESVNKAVNGVIREYTQLTERLGSLKSLSEQIAAASADTAQALSPPRRYDYYNYEDYAAAYSAYISSLSQSGNEEQRAKTQALLEKYGMSSTEQLSAEIAELTARISLAEGTVGASGSGFYSAAETLRARINAGDSAAAEKLFSLYGELAGELLSVPQTIGGEKPELNLPEYAMAAGGLPAAQVRERLISLISAACDTLSAAGAPVNAADYAFESVYTLPVYAVTKSFSIEAAVSLLLAVLVDVLSLLFAMIYVKEKSILTAKNTRSAADMRSDLFEKNVMTALQLGICAEGGSFSQSWDSSAMADRLAQFVGLFRAADFAADKGFSLIAERSTLGEYEALTAFLCQFGLAGTLSAEETAQLTGGETEEASVLLKTKFLLWVSERFCTPQRIVESTKEAGA